MARIRFTDDELSKTVLFGLSLWGQSMSSVTVVGTCHREEFNEKWNFIEEVKEMKRQLD